MKRMSVWALACCTLAGCAIDRAQYEATQQFAATVTTFAAAGDVMATGYGELASKKHTIQQAHVDATWSGWLATHTDADGRLVSTTLDGKVVPMTVEQLETARKLRDAAMDDLRTSKTSCQTFLTAWKDAVQKLKLTATLFQAENETAQTQKESMAEMLNSALKVIAGAGVGVLVAP